MTAVPNWTGRMPIVGRPLLGLFTTWGLGRASAEMTRRYQCRRDRFRVNLTRAAGL